MLCPSPEPISATIGQQTALLRWKATYANDMTTLPVSLQWRRLGDPAWNTVSSIIAYQQELTGLQTNQTYQWRLASHCLEGGVGTYTEPLQFITECTVPEELATTAYSFSSVTVSWPGLTAASYSVRWRTIPRYPPGGDWVEGPVVTGNQFIINGLSNGNQYEVQIRMVCGAAYTAWSPSVQVLATCGPTYIRNSVPRSRSALLSWASVSNASYEVQWRTSGDVPWKSTIIMPGLNDAIDSEGVTTALLTGLNESTDYGYRMQVLCSSDATSGFSPEYGFTTLTSTDLSIGLSASKRVVGVNDLVTLTGTLINQSLQPATNTLTISRLLLSMIFVRSNTLGVTSSGDSVSATVSSLAARGSTAFTFQARVTQPGIYQLAVQLVSITPDDADSYADSGTADGEDDTATIDLRTNQPRTDLFSSPNPVQRPLPLVRTSQPIPDPVEADLSLALQVSNRTPVGGSTIDLFVRIMNRGALTATNIAAQVTIPNGWQLVRVSPTGFTMQGQVVTIPITSLEADRAVSVRLTLQVQSANEQVLRAVITACDQPALNSSHGNSHGLGEDDEAATSVRVR